MTRVTDSTGAPVVLVVDDEITARMATRGALENAGFVVEEAEDGAVALAAIKTSMPNIIVLDVMMPVMDGFSLCEEVRRLPEGKLVPILMVTGLDDIDSIRRAYDVGATDFITKPFNWLVLCQRIRHMVRESQLVEEVTRRERTHRALLRAMPDVMLRINKEGLLLEPLEAKAFDFSESIGQLADRSIFEVLPADVAKHTVASMKRALEKGATESLEYELMLKGTHRHFEARIVGSGDNEAMVLLRDITERTQMEKAVQESEGQFREIFEGSPIGIVMVSADFHFVRANASFCRMTGYTEQELASRTFKDITHPDHIGQDVLHMDELVEQKIPVYRTEKRYIRKDKVIVWGSSTVSVARDRDGRFLYFLAAVEDITQRKQSEEEKTNLESQLRRSQKMEAIGTMAGGVAHDFNNILTVITGYSAMLKMEMGQNNPLLDYVEPIQSSAEKAAHLTRSLLSFSRHQPIVLAPVDLNENLRSVEKLLKRLLTEDIAINTILTSEDITVMADATQIDQILFNLATNARDAMPTGGTFAIETEAMELSDEFRRSHGYGEPGRYALLSVSDTGIGMDKAAQEKIFDPFYTTKEAGKGTGLGLSTVYGIVKQHRGFITVYSEPNIGTTFRIYLPTVSAVDKEERPASVPVLGGNETILVAEDNEVVRRLISKVLTQYGYKIVEAINGADAIEQFKKTDRVDLLILDSVMPIKNGRQVYDEIINMKSDIKVLFTSGYTRDIILDKGIEDKKFNFISKPISPSALLQKVRDVLDAQVLQ